MNKKIATKEFIEEKVLDLVKTFPLNGDLFWTILIQRLLHYKCTNKEVVESVDYVIDFISKEYLTVADVIQPILHNRNIHIVD